MKTNQMTIITIAAVLLFTLAGCDNTDGQLERKGPKLDLEKYNSKEIHWTVNGPVDASGNPVEPEEAE